MHFAPRTFAGLADEEIALFRHLLTHVGGSGVEIGCMDGFSSAIILDASKLYLTSIDPLVPDSMEPTLIGDRARYEANVAPYRDRTTLIRDFSQNVVSNWKQPLSFLFIDGDHSYEATTRDYEQWTPFLVPGGLLAVHDSRMGRPGGAPFHPGPSRMAQERVFRQAGKWQIIGEAFSLTVAQKL